jgi:UDP-N-acetylglucosamine acyltransferase
MATIHPTAVVHRSAELADDVRVGPYCVIGPDVRVAAGTTLHNHVTIEGPVTLGRENEVFPYAVLGAAPQDLKYLGHDTRLVIGDRNKVREHCTIHRGTEFGGSKTTIADDCLFMVGVHIAHDCCIESEVVIANNTMLGGHCLIEHGATLAGGVGVHHFTTVSKLAFVGGMSRIAKDVPPYLVVEGNPAEVRKLNTVALVRRLWSVERVEALRSAFRLLYRSPKLTTRDAIAVIRDEAIDAINSDSEMRDVYEPVLELCGFVERVEAGVHGRYLESRRTERSHRPE